MQKKEIVCPAPKQCICENCPCTRHTLIEPPVLYHPLNRAKRVHYVSVKVKLTKAKMTRAKMTSTAKMRMTTTKKTRRKTRKTKRNGTLFKVVFVVLTTF